MKNIFKFIKTTLGNEGGWLSAVTDIANTATSIWQNDQSNKQQQSQFHESMNMSAENLNWQKNFAKNRYQFAAEDMKKAGLNPILMYGSASAQSSAGGSSSPGSGSQSSGLNPMKFSAKDLLAMSEQKAAIGAAKATKSTKIKEGALYDAKEKAQKLQNRLTENTIDSAITAQNQENLMKGSKSMINEKMKYFDAVIERLAPILGTAGAMFGIGKFGGILQGIGNTLHKNSSPAPEGYSRTNLLDSNSPAGARARQKMLKKEAFKYKGKRRR